jgi:ferredoxin
MKRKIIEIDDSKCNGCGLCIPDCPEGALQMIDGKARLVSDLFCDGLGACIGHCPQGAISVVEREAEAYNEEIVMRDMIIPKGENTIKAHLKHLKDHNEEGYYNIAIKVLKDAGLEVPVEEPQGHACAGMCPGTLAKSIVKEETSDTTDVKISSQLRQWPVEMHLLNPAAQYFNNADLLIAADCTAFSYGNFHNDFIKGRVVIIFCPKLDHSSDEYIEKMTAILSQNEIKSITIARMEVPCCGGTTAIVQEAMARSGKDIKLDIKTISINGEIL